MSESFKIDFEWLPREYGDQLERMTLAEITIRVAGVIATDVDDSIAKTVRHSARLSAHRLAHWFSANWWRLRWEPESQSRSWLMSHKIGAAGGCYVWPDLIFASDGSFVHVASRATDPKQFQLVRYLASFDAAVTATAFEDCIDDFVEAVIGRLSSVNGVKSDLALLWRELLDERQDSSLGFWRKLEALLGFDPDEAPDDLIEQLMGVMDRWGADAIEEIAAASKDNAAVELKKLEEASPGASAAVHVPNLGELVEELARSTEPFQLPWQRAAKAAQVARSIWGIEQGPIPTKRLSKILSFAPDLIQSSKQLSKASMPAGYRVSERPEEVRIAFKTRHPTSRRSALARVIGDHLNARLEDRLLPVTPAKTDRQKFQRAFAQEFLCPFADLRAELPSDDPSDEEIEEMAVHFEVSPLMIRNMLVDKGIVDRHLLL